MYSSYHSSSELSMCNTNCRKKKCLLRIMFNKFQIILVLIKTIRWLHPSKKLATITHDEQIPSFPQSIGCKTKFPLLSYYGLLSQKNVFI